MLKKDDKPILKQAGKLSYLESIRNRVGMTATVIIVLVGALIFLFIWLAEHPSIYQDIKSEANFVKDIIQRRSVVRSVKKKLLSLH